MDDLRRQVVELVELVGLMDAWRMRTPVRSPVETDRLARPQTTSPVPPVRLLNGSEPFEGLPETTVLDFWRWGMSDIRTNTLRGIVAEFLVARAVGSTHPHRIEWDSYDVVTPEGITIEVKSAAYLQAWEQKRASRIEFSGLTARRLDDALGNYAGERGYNADVYVFAVQTATEHTAFDVLDTNQWEFYVAPRAAVEATRRRSLGLAAVKAVAGGPVALQNLHSTTVRVHGSA